MNPKIVTIGVYGYSEEAFFKTLIDAGVDTFCDLRQRRGMRGKKYAFVNSQHLQERLEELGIRYLHLRDLAPSQTVRERQKMADKTTGISKQARVQLSNEFYRAYQKEHLATFDSSSFYPTSGPGYQCYCSFLCRA